MWLSYPGSPKERPAPGSNGGFLQPACFCSPGPFGRTSLTLGPQLQPECMAWEQRLTRVPPIFISWAGTLEQGSVCTRVHGGPILPFVFSFSSPFTPFKAFSSLSPSLLTDGALTSPRSHARCLSFEMCTLPLLGNLNYGRSFMQDDAHPNVICASDRFKPF